MLFRLLFVCAVFSQVYGDGDRVAWLEERVDTLESILNAVVGKLETCNCQPSSIQKRQVTEGPIAFTAAVKPTILDHLHNQQVIPFDAVVTNIGGGYDNNTGVFTVPLTGIYMFTSSLLDHVTSSHGTAKLHAEIVLNGNMLVRVFAHADDNYRDQGANTVFTKVTKGDQVWVRIVGNSDLSFGGGFYSTLSGAMLWQMDV